MGKAKNWATLETAQGWALLPQHNDLWSISEHRFKAFHPAFLYNLINTFSSTGFPILCQVSGQYSTLFILIGFVCVIRSVGQWDRP